MRELFQELIRDLGNGETVALATIVRRKGSVPCEVGAKMLVRRGGQISGTVGGGCGEAEVWRSALNVIDTQRPNMVQVDLTEEIAMESQGVCGGIFDVFVQPWYNSLVPGQPSMQDYARVINETLEHEQAIVLATIIAAGGAWRECVGQQMLIHEDGSTFGKLTIPDPPCEVTTQLTQAAQRAITTGKPHIETITALPIASPRRARFIAATADLSASTPVAPTADLSASSPLVSSASAERVSIPSASSPVAPSDTWVEIFIEPFIPPPVLLIAGAGHIAAPLAALAHLMNFSVSVTDDRASFASRERFPNAKQLLVGDIESTLRNYPITPRTHIVLVTRAHAHDVQGLRAIIDSPASYIGMIGSQRRVWAVFKLLHEEGVPAEKLARVCAPIGLDLGGSTPEEIALCIMAEIIMLRHGGTGKAMSETLRSHYMQRLRRLDEHV